MWALRAFLYVWDPTAEPAVLAAGHDEHWRIREMVVKVIRANALTSRESELLLEQLTTDENHRVRTAAQRALR
ncbi:HEAT repeat domain-containing protein [Microbacterium sp. KUDC0406]|uniref:HEAT repeat domain-containing protein n=1 Tax=Microbacterium sp. KUDC0406 TaxID=2909588 RepID=UPI001F1EA9A2|nr:HEAT repeat domain-containing protein [Microbacterium sp. KUDC0406]UJP11003.1 HEAT repeat domain-containing protein [Microbacterium sp. KUDC0406]